MNRTRKVFALMAWSLLILQSCRKESSLKSAISASNKDSQASWQGGDPIINGRYKVTQYQNLTRSVCVVGNGLNPDNLIHQYSYSFGNLSQEWHLVKHTISSVDYFEFVNVKSGLALAAPNATPWATLIQKPRATDDKQRWRITHVSNSKYKIVNKANGMAMTLANAPGGDGTAVIQAAISGNGVAAQHFFFYNLDEYFFNPIRGSGADPFAAQRVTGEDYYYMQTNGSNITLYGTPKLSELRNPTSTTLVWTKNTSGELSADIWAPEMFWLNNKWWIYFSGCENGTPEHKQATKRTWVLEKADDGTDPTVGSWMPPHLLSNANNIAIDGTVLEIGTTKYFLWAGNQKIWISQMSSDLRQLLGTRQEIVSADEKWEGTFPVGSPEYPNGKISAYGEGTEGPEIIKRSNTEIYLTYSANGYWHDNYCIAQLKLTPGANPLVKASWNNDATYPKTQVFKKSDANRVWGTGHHSFFKSKDGTQDWLLYHAYSQTAAENPNRTRSPRMQRITWYSGYAPHYGTAQAITTAIQKPGGE